MAKFKGKYRIESARLKGHDYSSEGSYFITICAYKMQHFFGFIADEKMHLNEIGQMAEKFWKEIPKHFPHASLDEFIIMPNHMHGIITLHPQKNPVQTLHCNVSPPDNAKNNIETTRCGISSSDTENNNIETTRCGKSLPDNANNNNTETTRCGVSTGAGNKKMKMAAIRPKPGSISVIIGSYKSVVSKHAHKISKDFEWQERFYDRIIRDEHGFLRIATYIRNNPKNWKDDELFL